MRDTTGMEQLRRTPHGWVILAERERELFDSLPPGVWVRPMDVGGWSHSHHSHTLLRLAQKGAIERRIGVSVPNAGGGTRRRHLPGAERKSNEYRRPESVTKE